MLLMPFIPHSAEEILKGLNLNPSLTHLRNRKETGHKNGGYLLFSEFARFGGLVPSVTGESKVLLQGLREGLSFEKRAEKQSAESAPG